MMKTPALKKIPLQLQEDKSPKIFFCCVFLSTCVFVFAIEKILHVATKCCRNILHEVFMTVFVPIKL